MLLLLLLLCDAAIAAALLLLSITPLLLLLLPPSAGSLTQSRQWVQQPRTTGQICGGCSAFTSQPHCTAAAALSSICTHTCKPRTIGTAGSFRAAHLTRVQVILRAEMPSQQS